MIWDDDEQSGKYNQWEIPKKAETLVKRITELKSKSSMTISEGKELEEKRSELEGLQEVCSHEYQVMLLFHWHRRFCARCHKEDKKYRHRD